MGPHANLPVVYAGAPVGDADGVMIMVHGRNAAPDKILPLRERINRPRFACLAPTAAGGAWYPFSFLKPREENEPGLSSALGALDAVVVDLLGQGIPSHKIALLGFSQGACLASEFVLRHPRRYGGLLALSGGVLGPPGTKWDEITASYDGMPTFLGCSDIDGHVPKERVIETDALFTRLGARVRRTLYPGMGHLVNDDEIEEVRRVLDEIAAA